MTMSALFYLSAYSLRIRILPGFGPIWNCSFPAPRWMLKSFPTFSTRRPFSAFRAAASPSRSSTPRRQKRITSTLVSLRSCRSTWRRITETSSFSLPDRRKSKRPRRAWRNASDGWAPGSKSSWSCPFTPTFPQTCRFKIQFQSFWSATRALSTVSLTFLNQLSLFLLFFVG